MAASGAKVLMLRAVELARGQQVPIHARSTFSDEEGTWVEDVAGTGAGDRLGGDALGGRGRLRAARRARSARARRPRSSTPSPPSTSTSTRSSRTSGTGRPSSRSPSRRTTSRRRGARSSARRSRSARSRSTEISDLGKVSLVGAGMRSHPGRRSAHVPDARGRGDQPPADLDLADQDLLPHPAERRREGGARAPRRVLARRSPTRRVVSPPHEHDAEPTLRSGAARGAEPRPRRRRCGSCSSSRACCCSSRRSRVWINRVALNTSVFTDTSSRAPRRRRDPQRRWRRAPSTSSSRTSTSQAEIEEQLPDDYQGALGPGHRRAAAGRRTRSSTARSSSRVFQKLFAIALEQSHATLVRGARRRRRPRSRPRAASSRSTSARSSSRPPTASGSARRSRTSSPRTWGRSRSCAPTSSTPPRTRSSS